MHVYLAGPMSGLPMGEAKRWREAWGTLLVTAGHTVASPLRGLAIHDDTILEGKFDDGRPNVLRDLYDIRQADVVLANFEGATRASIGTCCELFAAYLLGKFTVTVLDEAKVHDHEFVNEASSIVVADMSAAFEWICAMGAPQHGRHRARFISN